MSMKEYPAKLTTGYYRVREDWEDEASQLGAYRLLANAKAKCDENPGSRVFDNDGNVIYPEEAVPVTGAEEAEEKPVMDETEGKVPDEEPSEEKDTPVTDEQKEGPGKEEYPTAEELPAAIAYGKLKTLMNIREMPNTSAEVVTIYKKNTLIEIDQMKNYPPEKMVLITTGSQGESMAALSRMAANLHRKVSIQPGDCVVFSSTPIPGNEKSVARVINELGM